MLKSRECIFGSIGRSIGWGVGLKMGANQTNLQFAIQLRRAGNLILRIGKAERRLGYLQHALGKLHGAAHGVHPDHVTAPWRAERSGTPPPLTPAPPLDAREPQGNTLSSLRCGRLGDGAGVACCD